MAPRTQESTGRRAFLAIGTLALLASGCGEDADETAPPQDAIEVAVGQWFVRSAVPSAAPGEVTFAVTNEGDIDHELLVVKTDVPPGSIPLDGEQFSETEVDVVDEVSGIAPGESATLTVELEPGEYELVCNLPGHYASGMHTSFSVTGAPGDTPDTGSSAGG